MTKFIELTEVAGRKQAKLTINVNNILQFFSVEPSNTGVKTRVVVFDGAELKKFNVRESYEDILRALEVKQIFDCNDENNARPQKSSTWVL